MIRVLPTPAAVMDTAATLFVELAAAAVRESGRFSVILAGGTTPRPLYDLLAGPLWCDRVDWSRVHLFWGDERCVGPDDARSNYRMVAESLLTGAPIPRDHIHRVAGEDPPGTAAAAYDRLLREFGGGDIPRLDLALLGLGADGHTASLFPGGAGLAESQQQDETTRLAIPVDGPDGLKRVTMTPSVLAHARTMVFLVTGRDKNRALQSATTALQGDTRPDDPIATGPAAQVAARHGNALWLVDEAAAGRTDGNDDRKKKGEG